LVLFALGSALTPAWNSKYLCSLTSTVGIAENAIPIVLGRRAVHMQEPSAWVFSAMELSVAECFIFSTSRSLFSLSLASKLVE